MSAPRLIGPMGRTPRLLTPIEAERQRIAQEQQRRHEAAKAAQRRPLEDLNYFVRIRNAAAKVDAFNRGYQQPESRPQKDSARPSWNASPRFRDSALDYATGELPTTPTGTRPLKRAPRRGGKARAADQGGQGAAEQATPIRSRPNGDGGDGAAGGGECSTSPFCELRCAALRCVQGIVAWPSARPVLGDRATTDGGGGATTSPFRYAAAALRKLSRRQQGEGSAVGLDGPLQAIAGFFSPGGSCTRHAPHVHVPPVRPAPFGSTFKVPP